MTEKEKGDVLWDAIVLLNELADTKVKSPSAQAKLYKTRDGIYELYKEEKLVILETKRKKELIDNS